MSEHKIHLRKLLQLFYLPEGRVRTILRQDVQAYIKKQKNNEPMSGMDFYSPFLRDAKDHVDGVVDLKEKTAERVERNAHRKNLYPRLAEKFLEWLSEKKRWTNEGISIFEKTVKGKYKLPDVATTVKVHNFLPLNVGSQPTKFFYPYFSDTPALTEEAARIGLWIMQQSDTGVPKEGLRILDVLRAKSYSLKKNPLLGNEEQLFMAYYKRIRGIWDTLYAELQ